MNMSRLFHSIITKVKKEFILCCERWFEEVLIHKDNVDIDI